MSEKSAIRLFTWKKSIVAITAGIGGVSLWIYQSYQQKGHLDSVDWVLAAITSTIVCCIVAFVGWWANKEE